MSESKSPLDRIYRLIASHTWMTENEAKVLLVMMYASGTKLLGLEGKGLNQFMENSLEKMCLDNKECGESSRILANHFLSELQFKTITIT